MSDANSGRKRSGERTVDTAARAAERTLDDRAALEDLLRYALALVEGSNVTFDELGGVALAVLALGLAGGSDLGALEAGGNLLAGDVALRNGRLVGEEGGLGRTADEDVVVGCARLQRLARATTQRSGHEDAPLRGVAVTGLTARATRAREARQALIDGMVARR